VNVACRSAEIAGLARNHAVFRPRSPQIDGFLALIEWTVRPRSVDSWPSWAVRAHASRRIEPRTRVSGLVRSLDLCNRLISLQKPVDGSSASRRLGGPSEARDRALWPSDGLDKTNMWILYKRA